MKLTLLTSLETSFILCLTNVSSITSAMGECASYLCPPPTLTTSNWILAESKTNYQNIFILQI